MYLKNAVEDAVQGRFNLKEDVFSHAGSESFEVRVDEVAIDTLGRRLLVR